MDWKTRRLGNKEKKGSAVSSAMEVGGFAGGDFMRESSIVNLRTKYCSGLIHQTKGEILNQVQNDNRSETGTEVSTPIDVASSFNWTEEKVRPSKDGPYKPIGLII